MFLLMPDLKGKYAPDSVRFFVPGMRNYAATALNAVFTRYVYKKNI